MDFWFLIRDPEKPLPDPPKKAIPDQQHCHLGTTILVSSKWGRKCFYSEKVCIWIICIWFGFATWMPIRMKCFWILIISYIRVFLCRCINWGDGCKSSAVFSLESKTLIKVTKEHNHGSHYLRKYIRYRYSLADKVTKWRIIWFFKWFTNKNRENLKELCKFKNIIFRSWIWDAGSGINPFRIPYQGVKEAPDPGSATLLADHDLISFF
jgi:hypothetical protein